MASSQYLNYIVAPNPLTNVSVSAGQINITPASIANNAVDQLLGTLAASFYPTVGRTYQITMNFTFDMTFAAPPAGVVNLALGYWNGTIYPLRASGGSYCATSATASDIYASMTLVFTHTSATNTIRLLATNLSGQTISSSTVLITGLSVSEISANAATITGTPIA
jgi:hypothetical protein